MDREQAEGSDRKAVDDRAAGAVLAQLVAYTCRQAGLPLACLPGCLLASFKTWFCWCACRLRFVWFGLLLRARALDLPPLHTFCIFLFATFTLLHTPRIYTHTFCPFIVFVPFVCLLPFLFAHTAHCTHMHTHCSTPHTTLSLHTLHCIFHMHTTPLHCTPFLLHFLFKACLQCIKQKAWKKTEEQDSLWRRMCIWTGQDIQTRQRAFYSCLLWRN